MKEDSTLKYDCVKKEIQSHIDRLKSEGYEKAPMTGVNKDLKRAKEKFEQFYDEAIWEQGWCLTDAPYFGWGIDAIKDMMRITDGIQRKALELYALILVGLGEDGA